MSEQLFTKEQEEFMKEISTELDSVKRNFSERVVTLVVGAVGLISALAWDEFLHEFFVELFPSDTLMAKFWYALAVTLVAVLASLWLRHVTISPIKRTQKFIFSLVPEKIKIAQEKLKNIFK